jgi:hypothetical protein
MLKIGSRRLREENLLVQTEEHKLLLLLLILKLLQLQLLELLLPELLLQQLLLCIPTDQQPIIIPTHSFPPRVFAVHQHSCSRCRTTRCQQGRRMLGAVDMRRRARRRRWRDVHRRDGSGH